MTDPYRPKGLSSAVSYQDPKAAYRWLEEAFGFEPLFVILDADGNLAHSEMVHGNSVLMVGNEWSADHKSPKSLDGRNTQTVHVQLAEGEDIEPTIIDLRPDSPTRFRHAEFELAEDDGRALYVPELFAHGFQTLADDTEILYQMGAPYAPELARGLRHDDPLVAPLEKLGEPIYVLDSNPTVERIAKLIFDQARELGFGVVAVRVWETPSSFAEYSEG